MYSWSTYIWSLTWEPCGIHFSLPFANRNMIFYSFKLETELKLIRKKWKLHSRITEIFVLPQLNYIYVIYTTTQFAFLLFDQNMLALAYFFIGWLKIIYGRSIYGFLTRLGRKQRMRRWCGCSLTIIFLKQ